MQVNQVKEAGELLGSRFAVYLQAGSLSLAALKRHLTQFPRFMQPVGSGLVLAKQRPDKLYVL